MNPKQMQNGKDQMAHKDDMMEQVKTASTSMNPFDLGKLKLSQDFGGSDGGGVKKKIMTVPVRKPNKQSFFRVVPGDDFKITTAILELKDDGSEIYLIHPDLRDELAEDMNIVQIVTTIDRQNNVVLWPIKLPKSDGRSNTWNDSAMAGAQHAEQHWIRLVPNMRLGAYEVFVAAKEFPSPAMPDVTFQQLIELAFKDRYITSMDHPVLKKLRGEE
jgi:hypothetical protein